MSLQPQVVYLVPEETARVARAAFPRGTNLYMRMRDALGTIFDDHQFAHLFSHTGQPAVSPYRLALVTSMQFAEGLSDQQAADAVRCRRVPLGRWKYALSLELTDPGFDSSVLSEFRTRLLAGGAEQMLVETLLTLLREQGFLKQRGRQRTASTHVLAVVQALNRLELVGETMRAARNSLAVVAPTWLRTIAPPEWFDRYAARCEHYRLPDAETQRQALGQTIGADGFLLLQALYATAAPTCLASVPAVEVLRQMWLQQYYGPQCVTWRAQQDSPPTAQVIWSPYDLDARSGTIRETTWIGYKVHITETCDPDAPHLIIDVTTTSATTLDVATTSSIQSLFNIY